MLLILKDMIKFIFGCSAPFSGGHDWINKCDGSLHRTCEWCGREQMLVYHRFGFNRISWVDSISQRIKDMPELP